MKEFLEKHMMAIPSIFTVVAILSFAACETKNASKYDTDIMLDGGHFQIYVLDSCEYLAHGTNASGEVIGHKGNCKFCKERFNESVKEIIQTLNK